MTDFDLIASTSVCVDYDDTIAVRVFGTVVPALGVVEGLSRLRANGYKIVIHSARAWEKFPDSAERVADMKASLDAWGVPYDEIYSGVGKPVAVAYVDDKAVRFDNNWDAIVESILGL
jgi:hypothetical protein